MPVIGQQLHLLSSGCSFLRDSRCLLSATGGIHNALFPVFPPRLNSCFSLTFHHNSIHYVKASILSSFLCSIVRRLRKLHSTVSHFSVCLVTSFGMAFTGNFGTNKLSADLFYHHFSLVRRFATRSPGPTPPSASIAH
jgi:hypothetical protein